MRTVDYLDAAKRAAHLTSDYALAARLGASRQSVSGWRKGSSVPDAFYAFRLAELAGVDPARVVADIELEKAEKADADERAAGWRTILGKLGGAAAGLAMAVGVTAVSAPSPVQASQTAGEVCVMSNGRRRRRTLLQAIDRLMHGMQAAPAF